MFAFTIALAFLCFAFGCMLLLSYESFKKISEILNRVVIQETWLHEHKTSFAVLFLSLAAFLFLGAYFIARFSVF